MLNRFLNWGFGNILKWKLGMYLSYDEPTKIAVVLVKPHRGLFHSDHEAEALSAVVDLATKAGWLVVYAPHATDPTRRFPVRAHEILDHGVESGPDLAPVPSADAIVLPASGALSAFSDGKLQPRLRAEGIERIVLAGPAAELAIDSTLRDGAQQDFHVTVLRGYSRPTSATTDARRYEQTWARYAHAILDLEELAKRAGGH